MSDEFPPVIGKYKVMGIIAKGGMGVVYKAFHPSLKRYVVIKKMTARGKSSNAERFKKEAQILLDLQSPYIVHLFDYFTEGGYRYMVEELVDGTALDNLIKKQTSLPCPVAMLFMQDACYALKYAHSKDIVHRDIKPGNILISKRGEIKLADFGIASDSGDNEENLTQTGVALGTPAYMPPEQFENSANVDNRADIYALGIMLYEMVTGTKPYPSSFSIETLNTIKKGKYISPRKIDRTVPKDICKLINKMIKPKAKQRYQSIDAVLKVIKKYLKHYDTHELRVQIAKSVLAAKMYEFPKIEQKDKTKRIVKRIIVGVLAAACIFAGCWYTGVIHSTILKKWYSAVGLEMEMPRALSENLDLPVRAFFFENDNDQIPEVNGSRRNFFEKDSRIIDLSLDGTGLHVKRPAAKNRTYVINKVFLKNGDYRVKVVVGPYVWWKSFTVGDEDLLIKCDFLKNSKRKLTIKPTAYDAVTGQDISGSCIFQVYFNNKWVPLDSVDADKIESATVWKIKVSADGYKDEIYSFLVDWYQDELLVSAQMKK